MPSVLMNQKLHNIMFGLYYPAVLGTGLVTLNLHGTYHDSFPSALRDPAIQLGAVFLLYFTASFAASFEPPKYGACAFIFDLIEVALMFLAFYFLRLFESSLVTPQVHGAYVVLVISILLQFAWRWAAGKKKPWTRAYLRLIAVAILIGGCFMDTSHKSAHLAVVLAVAGIILVYLFILKPDETAT
jgi:hypothetical protein